MLTDIKRTVNAPIVKSIWRSILIANASPPTPPPVLSLTASRTSCNAMGGIVFDATATTQDGVDTFADLVYLFDFGDSAASNYTNGILAGKSKQFYAGGPIAAHVYENPGSYTCSLWVYDGVTMHGPVTQAVTIADPDVVYAGTLTTVVSTDGDFAGAPAGATQVTSSDFHTAMSTYGGSGRRVLLRAGQSFTTGTTTLFAGGASAVYLGAFGAGDKPVVTATANWVAILQGLANGPNSANNARNWYVNGIFFKAASGVKGVSGVNPAPHIPAGSDISDPLYHPFFTVHDCEFEGPLAPALIKGGGNVRSKLTIHNVAHGVATSGGVALYSTSSYLCATIDCSADSQHGGEHVLRSDGGIKQQFSSNDLSNPADGKHYLTIRGHIDYVSTETVAEYNRILGEGDARAVPWTVQIAPNSVGAKEVIDGVLFRWNYLDVNQKCQIAIIVEASNVTIACNAFNLRDITATATAMVYIATAGGMYVPVPDNVRIFSNSCHYAPALGFTCVNSPSALVTNTQIKGNIAYAPNSVRSSTAGTDGPKFYVGSSIVDAANNSTDSQVKNTSPLFAGLTSDIAGFALQVGSPYRDQGLDLKVHIDALGFVRKVGGQFDAGAMNSVDKQSSVWDLV